MDGEPGRTSPRPRWLRTRVPGGDGYARVRRLLRERGGMSILLVEQYFDFAAALADTFAVMDRGEIVMAGEMQGANESAILKH